MSYHKFIEDFKQSKFTTFAYNTFSEKYIINVIEGLNYDFLINTFEDWQNWHSFDDVLELLDNSSNIHIIIKDINLMVGNNPIHSSLSLSKSLDTKRFFEKCYALAYKNNLKLTFFQQSYTTPISSKNIKGGLPIMHMSDLMCFLDGDELEIIKNRYGGNYQFQLLQARREYIIKNCLEQ